MQLALKEILFVMCRTADFNPNKLKLDTLDAVLSRVRILSVVLGIDALLQTPQNDDCHTQ
ncbi:hypothetical protein Ciccas_008404 [Cichlidogyrus casuarinus]|uniref:Uncharacterized protein n=1 Tax=Cichlidogyrus casuarinus TaxID=1844966 RepID=A0ABD2Q1B5_9PLAT